MSPEVLSSESLPGARARRVFVGGHYDFLPTLREIARFVEEVSPPGDPFYPVIPIDHDIPVEETMDRDLEILARCAYAIFDLSDLGGQLVEMQEARQKQTSIRTLLVYPVRKRRNEPERGRRTVLSFGLPHFGYTTPYELKGIVWRFLTGMPTRREVPPRVIYRPMLDREVRNVRVLFGRGYLDEALRLLDDLVKDPRFEGALELWLQRALVASTIGRADMSQRVLRTAERRLCADDSDRAEILYYRAAIDEFGQRPNSVKNERLLAQAVNLKPGDARFLSLLGWLQWQRGDRENGVSKLREALADRNVPDPMVAIQAMNNLAYFLAASVEKRDEWTPQLEEALEVSKYLPAYQVVFRRHNAAWLDTAGWILYLKAKVLGKAEHRQQEAFAAASESLVILESAAEREPENSLVQDHLREARKLKKELGRKGGLG